MLVICAGLWRSGSTWQYQVACELVRQAGWNFQPMGYLQREQLADFLSSSLDPDTCYLYKTHPPDPIHLSLKSALVVTLYSFRDLRDIAYSMTHKLQSTFQKTVREGPIIEWCIAADSFWSQRPGVVEQRYEDWVLDNTPFVRSIAVTLGIDLAETVLEQIVDEFGLQRNKARTAKLAASLSKKGIDLSERRNALLNDPDSLLHWNHIRNGDVGGWKSIALPEEKAYLAEKCGNWLIARGYEFDLLWATENIV
jgi:hypothetical protein